MELRAQWMRSCHIYQTVFIVSSECIRFDRYYVSAGLSVAPFPLVLVSVLPANVPLSRRCTMCTISICILESLIAFRLCALSTQHY
jgi:hypothetical protein